MKVVMLSPEAPYPLQGGGAFRTASLLHYFARIAEVDLILISETGQPALLPPGLVHSQKMIPLPRHSRSLAARYVRNASRAVRGVPPLVDRLAGLEKSLERALGGKRYDLGIVEHLWCAPYASQLSACCAKTVLDLHNIESVLHQRCAQVSGGLAGAGHRRFAAVARKLERDLLPHYSAVLVTSEDDARIARESRLACASRSTRMRCHGWKHPGFPKHPESYFQRTLNTIPTSTRFASWHRKSGRW
jgi:hypothetical protein